jgi:hypothetical protein
MTSRTELRKLEWPAVVPLADDERAEFRSTCEAVMAEGGPTGEIARDMLWASDRLATMKKDIVAFLERVQSR